VLNAGEVIAIKPFVPHKLTGIEKGTAIDVWSPGHRYYGAVRRFVVGESPKRVPHPGRCL